MKYLISNTVKYRVPSVTDVEELHAELKSNPKFSLEDFSYKTKYIKEKGEVVDIYQLVTAKMVFNDEKEPEDCFVDVSYVDAKVTVTVDIVEDDKNAF